MTEPDPFTVIAVDGAPNLAVDVQPDLTGDSFVLDVSELDGPELLGWGGYADDETAWLNVICDVVSVGARRGATRLQGPLTRAEAGELNVTLLDTERRFDPLVNADAVHAGTPVRLRAWSGTDPAVPDWSAVLFTAVLDDVPVEYPKTGPPVVSLVATDVIATLAAWSSTGRADPGVGQGDNLRERVDRVLDEIGLPPETVADDSDTDYVATLAPANLTDGWGDVVAAADAELGRVWADVTNRLVLRARESQLSGPVRGTLSDWHGEAPTAPHCCFTEPFAAALGTELLTNRAIAARRVPAPAEGDPTPAPSALVQRDDELSQALYRRVKVTEQRSLELETDGQLEPWCESLLVTSALAELRVDSVRPAPWTADDAAWRAVCETDLGDRWLMRYHPDQGPTVSRTIGVLGIEHSITPDGWSITWTTIEAPTPGENPTGWFALDVSELDGGDLLARFGGPVPAVV